jgi:hypothetical protein
MTANPPPSPEIGLSAQIPTELAELRELEKQFPEPTWDEVRADWEWLYAQFGTGSMQPYVGKLVAVYNKVVVGTDPQDELALRIRLAKQYQCHPERFVISYYG